MGMVLARLQAGQQKLVAVCIGGEFFVWDE